MAKRIEVLVVDDSPLFSEAIRSILEDDPSFDVVGVASDGRQAIEMTRRFRPKVITMDVHMPVMDGLAAIEAIMADRPTPILVVTADPRASKGDELHFEALRRGALDVFPKPSALTGLEGDRQAFRDQLKLLAKVTVVRHLAGRRHLWRHEQRHQVGSAAREEPASLRRLRESQPPVIGRGRVVAIVASTGGPAALAKIMEALPGDLKAPLLVTQHIAKGFVASFATWLNDVSTLEVCLARQDDVIAEGKVMIAPDSYHMTITSKGQVALDSSPPFDGHRPSGNPLFSSVAEAYGPRAIGLILSGMGSDGVQGLEAIRSAGGVTLAQDEASCVVFGMPKVALESGAASHAVTLLDIPRVICELVSGSRGVAGGGLKAGET